MSDVDTQDTPVDEERELTAADRLAEVVNRYQPINAVVYPETDALRAVLSGAPAGNADDLPPGTDEIREAISDVQEESLPAPVEKNRGEVGTGARDFKVDVASLETAYDDRREDVS